MSKTEKVIELLKEGKNAKEIAEATGCNQNYVYSVKSKLKTSSKTVAKTKPRSHNYPKSRKPSNNASNSSSSSYSSLQKLKKIIIDQAVEIAELKFKLI